MCESYCILAWQIVCFIKEVCETPAEQHDIYILHVLYIMSVPFESTINYLNIFMARLDAHTYLGSGRVAQVLRTLMPSAGLNPTVD